MSELGEAFAHDGALTGMLADDLDKEDPDNGFLVDVLTEKLAVEQRISELADRAWETARQAWQKEGTI